MKLNRLDSTTQHLPHEAPERLHPAHSDRIRRVEAMDGIEGDRERSLQQEIAAVDPKVNAPYGGDAHVLADARQVAAELTLLGSNACGLIKLQALSLPCTKIDDKV